MASVGKKKRGDRNVHKNTKIGDDYTDRLEKDDQRTLPDSEEMDVQEHVQVDFEARNPEDSDFHGMKKLLQQVFLKANINVSELTDALISQNYVGSVIKQPYLSEEECDTDDDDDADLYVYGVTSVINITERESLECVRQLKQYLTDRCKQNSPEHVEFSALMHDPTKQLGFLINERFINIPPVIALPAFQALWTEVEKANRKRMKYDFTDFVMICKTYRMPVVAGGQNAEPVRVFVNPEEEYFAQEACLSFDFSVQSERDSALGGEWDEDQDELEPFRTVLVIKKHSVQTIMDKLSENFSQQ